MRLLHIFCDLSRARAWYGNRSSGGLFQAMPRAAKGWRRDPMCQSRSERHRQRLFGSRAAITFGAEEGRGAAHRGCQLPAPVCSPAPADTPFPNGRLRRDPWRCGFVRKYGRRTHLTLGSLPGQAYLNLAAPPLAPLRHLSGTGEPAARAPDDRARPDVGRSVSLGIAGPPIGVRVDGRLDRKRNWITQ